MLGLESAHCNPQQPIADTSRVDPQQVRRQNMELIDSNRVTSYQLPGQPEEGRCPEVCSKNI